ncbi:MAG: DEAD/DEAH box helicase [Candidatus Sericytochromatia bacterium]
MISDNYNYLTNENEFSNNLEEQIILFLKEYDFIFYKKLLTSSLYLNEKRNLALIIDSNIQNKIKNINYTEYTREQNHLMFIYNGAFRFNIDNLDELKNSIKELKEYLSDGVLREEVSFYGSERDLNIPDPSTTEFNFEELFEEIYGRDSLNFLKRELPFVDFYGKTRWIDYSLNTKNFKIAIELNGETYHHPAIITKEKYLNQLVKQNSMVASGFKVYRWSSYGIKNKEICSDEIVAYFGNKLDFILENGYKANRNVIILYEHQKNALISIEEKRSQGKNSFLIVLPTGSGKTEILYQDLKNLFIRKEVLKALILVPQVNLKNQLIEYFKVKNNELNKIKIGEDKNDDIIIQTYQYITRHYSEFKTNTFQYIVIDEAHHAVAPAIKKVINYFNPENLLGLTATDQRMDQQKLESIFGEYETSLSLKDAIENDILVPIRAFRVKSNIDLSEIRFNGKDYVSSDLQKTVIVPSRDQLIVDTLKKYFVDSNLKDKSGIIFCVSIAHSEKIANLLFKNGINASFVTGKNKKESNEKIDKYLTGEIQFLCTCQLLNEGWDAPRTEIIVMARPTMSKVLYQQQLGRGTRKYLGKESLYVIDIVDNYSPYNSPWSVHSLLGISSYMPWAMIAGKNKNFSHEEIILAGLYEKARAIEEIDIFTFQNKYEGYLSPEQLARELFISTGTVLSKIKKSVLKADIEIPFGNKKLFYFSPKRIETIRKELNLSIHDETTIYQDFFEFLEKGDYTFSYKIIFLLSLLKHVNKLGECDLDILTEEYTNFYINRFKEGFQVEKNNSPYNKLEYLQNKVEMKKSLLQNPFEKFERKRFMYHCKDLKIISFSSILWNYLKDNQKDILRIKEILEDDKNEYFKFNIRS